MFAAFGTVTDCTLKFTKDGKFRKFGFVGFKSEEDANTALKHFDKSFVDTSRVTVWLRDGVSVASASNLLIFQVNNAFTFICRWKCVSLLEIDPTKPKAWSKHTQGCGHDRPRTEKKKVTGLYFVFFFTD